MIVSPGRGYVFVHIPKTAGTAMALALEARAMKDDILVGDTPKARRRKRRLKGLATTGRLWKHSRLSDIGGLLKPGELERLFAFTLVRNPWDRTVSYYHWLKGQTFTHEAVRLAQQLDFEAFVLHPHTRATLAGSPAVAYMRRIDGSEQCAAYIRIEHLEEDAAPLWAHLGFRLDLPRANASDRHADYRAYYSDAAAAAIASACATDIARFGYTFD
ncbi:sulfotransferase family 2 domain-containing protein [Chachezhania sediminis]|uniref:sulfotransferase family 2 domain-containing protein n=1 Tax=Chachezhania sediminis TaxID=2599291 RepID=UPI00131BB753|nr:sulfotransferase family 2 domain-containing protein [Chachezhania sediminis]